MSIKQPEEADDSDGDSDDAYDVSTPLTAKASGKSGSPHNTYDMRPITSSALPRTTSLATDAISRVNSNTRW